jgi:hypothetical protein
LAEDDIDQRIDAALAISAANKVAAQREAGDAAAEARTNAEAWQTVCDGTIQPVLEAIAERLRSRGLEAVTTSGASAVELAFLRADSSDTLDTVSSMDLPRIRFHIHHAEPGISVIDRNTHTREHAGQNGELVRLRFAEVTPDQVSQLALTVVEQALSK